MGSYRYAEERPVRLVRHLEEGSSYRVPRGGSWGLDGALARCARTES
jgi:hypothetical protein